MKHFAGIIDITELENISIFSLPICFISNIQEHWFSIWVSRDTVEVYDSLGEKSALSKSTLFVNFLCNNLVNRRLKFSRQIQTENSQLCGQYCITCLKLRSQNLDFDEINCHFSHNLGENELIILNLFTDI